MPRRPLPIGTWGEMYLVQLDTGQWMARVQYRGNDGITRTPKRHGKTKNDAKNNLLEALGEMAGEDRSGELTSGTRVRELAKIWFTEQERLAAQGSKQITTVDQYRDHYRRHIEKALGELRLRECTVSRLHKFLVALSERSSSTAVMCRKVLSGMLGYAVTHKALTVNPVRDVGRIQRKAKKKPKALEAAQIRDWLTKVDSHELAKTHDLPDLSRFFLGTGLRIGEALAVSWREIDLRASVVRLDWHMVYIKGRGVQRVPSTKGEGDEDGTELELPGWCVDMLRERRRRFGAEALWGPVFPHPTTRKYRDPREMRKVLRAVRGDLGYPWLTSHQLGRKTVATLLDEGGASAREIADQLRHARPSMTQDVYMARGRVNSKAVRILESMMDETG